MISGLSVSSSDRSAIDSAVNSTRARTRGDGGTDPLEADPNDPGPPEAGAEAGPAAFGARLPMAGCGEADASRGETRELSGFLIDTGPTSFPDSAVRADHPDDQDDHQIPQP